MNRFGVGYIQTVYFWIRNEKNKRNKKSSYSTVTFHSNKYTFDACC